MEEKTCPVCGNIFDAKTNKKYCCPQCARKAGVEKAYGNIKRRTAIKAKQNPDLLIAYDSKCAVCGWHLPTSIHHHQRGCDFHHIIPVCDGGSNTEDNLILLCPNCHREAHAGFISRERLLRLTFTKEEARMIAEAKYFQWAINAAEIIDNAF